MGSGSIRRIRFVVPTALLTLAMLIWVGCAGGRSVEAFRPSGIGEQHDAAGWPSPTGSACWDPLAPAIETLPLDEALKQAPVVSHGSYRVAALGLGNQPDTAALAALYMEQQDGALTIRTTRPLADLALYLRYDPQAQCVQRIDAGRDGAVSLAFVVEPGLVAIGLAATSEEGLDPTAPVATVWFAPGAETALRRVSTISQVATTAVRDFAAVHEGSGTATLGWHERHTGDYNLDGEVNLSDLTPIGFWYQEPVNPEGEDWAETEVVDGNEDGLITINDITQIGQNFRSFLTGYNVYRITLASPEDEPTPADDGWVKVENAADPSGPSASREGMYNGQKTRLVWTFLDEPEVGLYAWYVAPTGRPGETPFEGPPSNVAKHGSGVLPGVHLTFEIQPPADELLSVDDEFYLGIKVTNAANLFCANVRFEYDATLVEFIETVPFYTAAEEHANLLTDPESPSPPERNPLFLGADAGPAPGAAGYRLAGFGATKMRGEGPRSGTGMLGYAKFRVISAGGNFQCFRFPQATTFIYLWGSQYGVPTATPVLGPPQSIGETTPLVVSLARPDDPDIGLLYEIEDGPQIAVLAKEDEQGAIHGVDGVIVTNPDGSYFVLNTDSYGIPVETYMYDAAGEFAGTVLADISNLVNSTVDLAVVLPDGETRYLPAIDWQSPSMNDHQASRVYDTLEEAMDSLDPPPPVYYVEDSEPASGWDDTTLIGWTLRSVRCYGCIQWVAAFEGSLHGWHGELNPWKCVLMGEFYRRVYVSDSGKILDPVTNPYAEDRIQHYRQQAQQRMAASRAQAEALHEQLIEAGESLALFNSTQLAVVLSWTTTSEPADEGDECDLDVNITLPSGESFSAYCFEPEYLTSSDRWCHEEGQTEYEFVVFRDPPEVGSYILQVHDCMSHMSSDYQLTVYGGGRINHYWTGSFAGGSVQSYDSYGFEYPWN